MDAAASRLSNGLGGLMWMLAPILVTGGAVAVAVLIVRWAIKRPDVMARLWVRRLVLGLCCTFLGTLAMLFVIGTVNDGIDRYRLQSGTAGTSGTLTLERIVRISVGRPPPIKSWAGTFESDDGRLRRSVRLAEGLPDGDRSGRPGQMVRVRLSEASPDKVYLAAGTRAFRNWVEAQIFLYVFLGLIGVVALIRWRHRRSSSHTLNRTGIRGDSIQCTGGWSHGTTEGVSG